MPTLFIDLYANCDSMRSKLVWSFFVYNFNDESGILYPSRDEKIKYSIVSFILYLPAILGLYAWGISNFAITSYDPVAVALIIYYVLIFLPAPFFILFSPSVSYFKDESGNLFFKVRNDIISYDEIKDVKYFYGYSKPWKYSIFSTVYYFNLKSGRKIYFCSFFEGNKHSSYSDFSDLLDSIFSNTVARKMKKIGLNVIKQKFKNL